MSTMQKSISPIQMNAFVEIHVEVKPSFGMLRSISKDPTSLHEPGICLGFVPLSWGKDPFCRYIWWTSIFNQEERQLDSPGMPYRFPPKNPFHFFGPKTSPLMGWNKACLFFEILSTVQVKTKRLNSSIIYDEVKKNLNLNWLNKLKAVRQCCMNACCACDLKLRIGDVTLTIRCQPHR